MLGLVGCVEMTVPLSRQCFVVWVVDRAIFSVRLHGSFGMLNVRDS